MSQDAIIPQEPISRFATSGPRTLDLALIQVPDVSRFRPRPIRAEAWSGEFTARRTSPRPRPRRRLRREIRMTAYACLATLPLLVAAGVWSVHSTARRAGASEVVGAPGAAHEPISARPLVWLSVEPVETRGAAASETPVVFPGYLLPADHREESSHEGS